MQSALTVTSTAIRISRASHNPLQSQSYPCTNLPPLSSGTSVTTGIAPTAYCPTPTKPVSYDVGQPPHNYSVETAAVQISELKN